ncbi:MAG: DUF58 domain-containing protein [Candidatus Poribacteria bacterium]|jgi:uncharacterized protein (DUF58 family)|nr:DUF58 domain-containing protein [Candidatus Poribacteria bacterium]MDP6749005.1 DUF58 domain-containing protein [Candidatus Poribacteria bacterium]MDP6997979.1 DUF58 domain-containing protein [Candidatus Poribacteria bacterium]
MLANEIIRRVKEIQVRTGRQVADVLAGEYVSVFKGGGIEFEEVRPYVPGDDVRSIDWNVTARVGQPFVKRYVEERQLTLMLMADISPSQEFGSVRRSKREAAAELCALLAFSAIQNDDKVGLCLFHGGIEQFIPPRKGQKHALRVVREVLAHGQNTPEGRKQNQDTDTSLWQRLFNNWRREKNRRRSSYQRGLRAANHGTDIGQAMEFLLSVSKRKSVCFLVSDFMDDDYQQALMTANRKHDVVAVLISDPRELEMPSVGLIALQDSENGVTRLYDTSSRSFKTSMSLAGEERVATLEQNLRRRGIDFIHIDASGSVVDPLVNFFRMREKRLRR